MCAVACEARHLITQQNLDETQWCDCVRESEEGVLQKTLLQFGQRCQ